MPLQISTQAPTLLVRRSSFERANLTRQEIDHALNLTDDEFRVEGELIVIGPVHDAVALERLVDQLTTAGLEHFDDFFDMSGNWPDWLMLFVQARARSGSAG